MGLLITMKKDRGRVNPNYRYIAISVSIFIDTYSYIFPSRDNMHTYQAIKSAPVARHESIIYIYIYIHRYRYGVFLYRKNLYL